MTVIKQTIKQLHMQSLFEYNLTVDFNLVTSEAPPLGRM